MVDKTTNSPLGLRGKNTFSSDPSNMAITKGDSQEQEFFESHYFLHQNGPQPDFQTYRHKTLAHKYF